MAGRHRKFDEDQVLKQASEVFWNKGYESTTTEELLDAMSLNKGSLYNAFGNKKQLYQQVINFHASNLFRELAKKIESSDQPLEVIRDLFREVCDAKSLLEHQRGCFFANAVTELNSIDQELEELAAEKLKRLEQYFKECLDKAQRLNQLSHEVDTSIAARYLLSVWNGIQVTRRIYPSRKMLEPLLRISLQIINQ